MQGRSFYSHWTDVMGRRRLCITLFFNLFWHAKYFHFCSGSRSAEDAADCTAYCGGADEGPAFCQTRCERWKLWHMGLTKNKQPDQRLLQYQSKSCLFSSHGIWTYQSSRIFSTAREQIDKILCFSGNLFPLQKRELPQLLEGWKERAHALCRRWKGEHCTPLHVTQLQTHVFEVTLPLSYQWEK